MGTRPGHPLRFAVGIRLWNNASSSERAEVNNYLAGLNKVPPEQLPLSREGLYLLIRVVLHFHELAGAFLVWVNGKRADDDLVIATNFDDLKRPKLSLISPTDQVEIHQHSAVMGQEVNGSAEVVYINGQSITMEHLSAEDEALARKIGHVVDMRQKH